MNRLGCVARLGVWGTCGVLAFSCARAERPRAQEGANSTATVRAEPAAATTAEVPPLDVPRDEAPGRSAAPELDGLGTEREKGTPAPVVAPGARSPSPSQGELRDAVKKKDKAPSAAVGAGRSRDELLPSPKPSDGEVDDAEALSSQLLASFQSMELALSAPDCISAGVFRDRVCELAERICKLAGDNPTRGVAERCGDGRARCTDARRRFSLGCPTP
jgi:hypothetical protein